MNERMRWIRQRLSKPKDTIDESDKLNDNEELLKKTQSERDKLFKNLII